MKEKVYDELKKMNIEFEIVNHNALYSEKDEENKKVDFKGAKPCKNLLVKPEKSQNLYLICLPLNKKADLKKVQNHLNSKRLSFAKEEDLIQNLGVKSGSASVLNIIEKPDTKVKFILDTEMKEYEKVAFHPNDNTASVIFNSNKIEKILENYNAEYEWIEI